MHNRKAIVPNVLWQTPQHRKPIVLQPAPRQHAIPRTGRRGATGAVLMVPHHHRPDARITRDICGGAACAVQSAAVERNRKPASACRITQFHLKANRALIADGTRSFPDIGQAHKARGALHHPALEKKPWVQIRRCRSCHLAGKGCLDLALLT